MVSVDSPRITHCSADWGGTCAHVVEVWGSSEGTRCEFFGCVVSKSIFKNFLLCTLSTAVLNIVNTTVLVNCMGHCRDDLLRVVEANGP